MRIVTAREQVEMLLPWREASPWSSAPGDPTYRIPVPDLKRHRQFNPAVTTPEQMHDSLWTQRFDGSGEYRKPRENGFSSGGGDERSREDELVEGFESGSKLPPVEVVTDGQRAILSDGNHRLEVADMLSHPDLESYIHYSPHESLGFSAETIDPHSALGKHIDRLVQSHPYQPIDGAPSTRYVFRKHPETGRWQRGIPDHGTPHVVDTDDYLEQMRQHFPPGTFDDGLGNYYDVDFGNGFGPVHQRRLHAQMRRQAGATQDWYATNPQLSRPDRPALDAAYAGALKQHRYPDEIDFPLYHGSAADFAPGDLISSGHPGNFVRRMKHVYVSDAPEKSHQYGGKVYEVRPTGPIGHRRDARPEQGYYASEWPMQVVRQVPIDEYADRKGSL